MAFHKKEIVFEALQTLGQKAILVGDALRPPQDCGNSKLFHISSIPYPYLLQQCSMMLCHGGAGVVQACLRAGIPCLISPLMGDQFCFAALIQGLGLGRQCGPNLTEVTSVDIVQAVEKVQNSSSLTDNCARLGKLIREEASSGRMRLVNLLEEATATLEG
jgi:UDP:flavonoid glycosyltransferase YjiC (YdhE family)